MLLLGFPDGASGKELTCQCRRQERCGLNPWVGKIPWRRAWQPTPVFLPGESHGQRSLAGYSPQCCRMSDTTKVTSCVRARLHTHTHTHRLLLHIVLIWLASQQLLVTDIWYFLVLIMHQGRGRGTGKRALRFCSVHHCRCRDVS